jgi:hypothetical protein
MAMAMAPTRWVTKENEMMVKTPKKCYRIQRHAMQFYTFRLEINKHHLLLLVAFGNVLETEKTTPPLAQRVYE